MPPPDSVTDANCGVLQVPSSNGPPVNCASGGLVGKVTAVPIFCTTDAENSEVLDCPEAVDEGNFAVLDPEAGVVVGAQPKKFGIVTLTPAQSWELNATASGTRSV